MKKKLNNSLREMEERKETEAAPMLSP